IGLQIESITEPKRFKKQREEEQKQKAKTSQQKHKEIKKIEKEKQKLIKDYKEKHLKIFEKPSEHTYTLPKDTGYNTRISEVIDIGSKLNAILDLRERLSETDDKQINIVRKIIDDWFDDNFTKHIKELPPATKPSHFFTNEKLREKYFELLTKGKIANEHLEKLRKSLFETINVTREGKRKSDKTPITDEDVYNRAELFSLYNFLHGYSLGEQIDFYGLKDKYLEKEKRKTRDDEVVPGGKGYRFQEYPIVTTDTLKKYLGKTAIKKDDELEFHRRKKTIREDKEDKDKGYRDISGKKIDYYFKEGKFRHVVSDEEMV